MSRVTPATVTVVTVWSPYHGPPLSSTKKLSSILCASRPLIFRDTTGVDVPRGCSFQYHSWLPSNTKEMSPPGHGTNSHSMAQRPSPDMEKSRSPSTHSGHLRVVGKRNASARGELDKRRALYVCGKIHHVVKLLPSCTLPGVK